MDERVSVVGRPNVGKSTLVNRLAAGNKALVGAMPGLTRDVIEADVEWAGRTFVIADSGGVLEEALSWKAAETIGGRVAQRAMETVANSSIVLFVVDGRHPVTAEESAMADRLREMGNKVILVGNKIDDASHEADAISELSLLGLGAPVLVSALHGRGAGELLDQIIEALQTSSSAEPKSQFASIAIVGRPNVGKSSLFNRIAGVDRSIVHGDPGTTRDAIDTWVDVSGVTYRFIDTAGVRRAGRTTGIEKMGGERTAAAVRRADLAIMVIDAAEGVTSQDQRIARQVAEEGVGALVALNKWDLVKGDEEVKRREDSVAERLGFLSYAPHRRISALTGRGVEKLLADIPMVLEERIRRVPTSRFNKLLGDVQQSNPPPRKGTRGVRVKYGTQASTAPPTFVVFASGELSESWLRFVRRRLREEYGFQGNPIRIKVRAG
jgi:GTP-binding protein